MSRNPFRADEGRRRRHEELRAGRGERVVSAARATLAAQARDATRGLGGVLLAADVAALLAAHGLADAEELMLLLLPLAQDFARPPISEFFVGAVGLERETGNLVLGGNVEFPGTHLGTTIHGEGFVATRAYMRGTSLAAIAIGEAHPCAHCRQYLSEFASSGGLTLIDPLGHRLDLAALYPWPFGPAYLGESGAVAGTTYSLDVAVADGASGAAGDRLLAAGRRAYAPYGKCPSAVVLGLADDASVEGVTIESVAYNPTIAPLQAALIELLANGYGYDDIVSAELGTVVDGAVDQTAATRELLGRIAPGVPLNVVAWRP